MNQFALTCDIDWAPDEILKDFVSLVNQYGMRCTFFCTHEVQIQGHELALHPNYCPDVSYEETIASLQQIFPRARGIRSHTLLVGSQMYPVYRKLGLVYQSNYMMFNQSGIRPFFVAPDVVELPIFCGDYTYISFLGSHFDLKHLDLESDGLKVLSFHPIHVFLNTADLRVYEEAKSYYRDPGQLVAYRNPGPGVRTLLTDLLEYVVTGSVPAFTLSEINDMWRQRQR